MTLFLMLGGVTSANKNCLKMLNEYVPSDNMIKVVYLSEKNLTFYINNIRNFKGINIAQYGFDSAMANSPDLRIKSPIFNNSRNSESKKVVKLK